MVKFIFNGLLAIILLMALELTIIGCMFVLRVVINIWFETDFMDRVREWINVFTKKD